MTTEGQLSSNLPVASMSRNPSVKNQRGIVTPLSEGSKKGLQSRGDEQGRSDSHGFTGEMG